MSHHFSICLTGLCEPVKHRVYELATKGRGPVGSAAVEVLVALKAPRESRFYWSIICRLMVVAETVSRDIHLSNILGYLDATLPRLDAEVGATSSPDNIDDLPPIPLVNGEQDISSRISFCS